MLTAPGGIGHVGIVIDNTPTHALHGSLGRGNASLLMQHGYGNLALALSTRAPSVFAGISGGLLGPRQPPTTSLRDGQAACEAASSSAAGDGGGERGVDGEAMAWVQLPAMAEALGALTQALAEARASARLPASA